MGKAVEATVLSMIREIVFGVGFALLLPVRFGLDGVMYSMPLSDILTFAIAVYLIIKTYKECLPDINAAGIFIRWFFQKLGAFCNLYLRNRFFFTE